MPAPFLSYLRVYEPLRAFAGPGGAAVRAGLARGAVRADRAGRRERELCLRATVRGQLLPGDELGAPEDVPIDVLVLGGEGGEPFLCPLDVRPRAAAAVLAFLDEGSPVLRAAALPVGERTARRRAEHAITELGEGAAHVVAASWVVPLPWFALVDQDERQITTGAQRRVWWRVPIGKALGRASRAESVVRAGLGEVGPAEVLRETRTWLERFDRTSIVELDYGGLVDLYADDALRADDSAAEVQRALRLLQGGDADGAAECYQRLRTRWGAIAARQRFG